MTRPARAILKFIVAAALLAATLTARKPAPMPARAPAAAAEATCSVAPAPTPRHRMPWEDGCSDPEPPALAERMSPRLTPVGRIERAHATNILTKQKEKSHVESRFRRGLEVKSHNSPDELRTPSKTRVEVTRLDGFTLGRIVLDRAGAGRSA